MHIVAAKIISLRGKSNMAHTGNAKINGQRRSSFMSNTVIDRVNPLTSMIPITNRL